MRGMGVKGQQVSAEQANAATPLSMAAMAGPAVCVLIVPGVLSRKSRALGALGQMHWPVPNQPAVPSCQKLRAVSKEWWE